MTGVAGLVAVDEMVARLRLVAELDAGIGPIKQRARGLIGGQLLVGMVSAHLLGQDCLAGLDRIRADVGSVLLSEAPLAPSTTAGRLAGCFGPDRLRGIESGLTGVYRRWLTLVPASVRAALVTRNPTIDLDASDIEVYGRTEQGVGWNYAGVGYGRVHLANWAQAELPLAMPLWPVTTISDPTRQSCSGGRSRCCRRRSAADLGSLSMPATSMPPWPAQPSTRAVTSRSPRSATSA